MTAIEKFLLSPHVVDFMLLFVAAEIVVLLAWRRRTGRGIATRPLLKNLGAGVSLMLALRASLAGAGWHWVAVCLISALGFHLADLRERWG